MTEVQNQTLTLRYHGVSHYTLEPDGAQRVCIFTDQERQEQGSALLKLTDPLGFREGLRVLLELAGLRGAYQPVDADTYQRYAAWRRELNPTLSPVELTRAFYAFLSEHDPSAWVGCDPTLSLNEEGLSFELLDPSGRLYGSLYVPASSYERVRREGERISEDPSALSPLCAQFEGGVSLREGLGRLNTGQPALLSLNEGAEGSEERYLGEVQKRLPAPANWQRSYTQLLAASSLSPRRVPLSRIDLYNMLQQLRLNADLPKQKNGVRFELIPGKAPAVTLEPWGWRMTGTGGVYRGPRAELIGVWDRRDLLILDALLPYVQGLEAVILGEAQPTYWVVDCGSFSFTLAAMGFRPNNWSRGLLLDVSLPREPLAELDERALSALKRAPLSAEALSSELGVTAREARDSLRRLTQSGQLRPQLSLGEPEPRYQARALFESLDLERCRYRNEREELGQRLVHENRVKLTIGELPTGELEVRGEVTEPQAAHMATEPTYLAQFQLKEGAGMRKLSCDCAWMKDREKAKSGPCAHAQALWLRYALDEAARLAELAEHPERVEQASSLYVRRDGDRERSRLISLKRRRLDERWEGSGESPRELHKVFNSIEAARAAYFQRVAELERRDYMDASQS